MSDHTAPEPTCLPCGNKIPGFADALAAAHARGVAEGRERGSCDLRADEIATARAEGAAEALASMREEWTVRHSQGTHPGPFTEREARNWIADDIKRDDRRQQRSRGRQKLLRRLVTEWAEVDYAPTTEAGTR